MHSRQSGRAIQGTGGGFPNDPSEVLAALAQAGLKVEAFQKLGQVRAGALKPSPPELVALWEEGITELDQISHQVDKLQV